MLVADLSARIQARVPALAGRCRQALDLAEMLKTRQLPTASPTVFILPLGLIPRGAAEVATGAFRQMVDEAFGVLIFVRTSGDPTGARAQPLIDELIDELIGAICGWGPEEAVGVFQLRRGQLHSAVAGGVFYQLDFGLQQQVRIFS